MTITIKAEEVSNDNFIYLPKENRYFFVNNHDHIDDKVWFYSEKEIKVNNKIKFDYDVIKFNKNDLIEVVCNYNICTNDILNEVKEFYEGKKNGKENIDELKKRLDEYNNY